MLFSVSTLNDTEGLEPVQKEPSGQDGSGLFEWLLGSPMRVISDVRMDVLKDRCCSAKGAENLVYPGATSECRSGPIP